MSMVSTSVAIALATAAIDGISPAANSTREAQMTNATSQNQNHPYLGMWVTGDGHVRQELLPNGRYDEARGNRKVPIKGAMRSMAIISTIGTIRALPQTASSWRMCCITGE
jgi:hypothetical protein